MTRETSTKLIGFVALSSLLACIDGTGPDAFSEIGQTENAATTSGVGRPVFVTNRGYDFDGVPGPHTVASYTIGPAGELVSLGEPVETGFGARGIVVSPDGRTVHVVAMEEHAVYSYRVGAGGELTPLGTPVDTLGRFSFGIAMAPLGRSFYVTNSGSGTVSAFAVDRSGTPTLLHEPVVTGGANPRNLGVTPDGRFLFVAHGQPFDDVPDVLVTFPILADGGLGPVKQTLPIGASGTGVGFTPDGTFAYIICSVTDDIHAFRIGRDGELEPVPGSPFSAPSTPEGIAMMPDGRKMFVTAVAARPTPGPDHGVWTFLIAADGSLTPVGTRADIGTGPGLTLTPDGRHLYVSNFFDNTVAAFETTALQEIAGSPTSSRGEAPSFNGVNVVPNQGPRADFTFGARNSSPVVRFDATASSDRDGSIARYDWDFGDGTVLTDGGPRPRHVYRSAGPHRVTLVVTDNEGCSDDFIFTGRTALCTGGPAARKSRLVRR